MAINSLDDIWAFICEECKKTISEQAVNCFLIDLKPLMLNGGDLSVLVANDYMKSVLEQTYGEYLNQAAKTVMGIDITVRFVVDEEEERIRAAEESNEGLTFEDFFTFDNFIVGMTNQFAHAVSLAVANGEPNERYNPLVIYGPSGVGKTHLMLAIKNQIKKKFPYKKVLYVRSEDFTNRLIKILNEGKVGLEDMNEFRNTYRNVDVLLMDDIHFIAGKESTQEEFFNTFNTLYQNNKRIVVTLDRPPKEIKTLNDRIRSRFEGGLFADILPPDFETRVGIIYKKADRMNIALEESIVYYIADHIKSNTRQIEGVVKKLQAYITIQNKQPNISVVQGFIKDVINDSQPEPIKPETIIAEVAKTYNVSESEILSSHKSASLVLARRVAMYITREITGFSYKEIGEVFHKDHTTVLYNVNKIEKFLADKPYEKELINDIIKNLRDSSGSY